MTITASPYYSLNAMVHAEVHLASHKLSSVVVALEGVANLGVPAKITATGAYSKSGSIASVFDFRMPPIALPFVVPLVVDVSVPISAGYSVSLEAAGQVDASCVPLAVVLRLRTGCAN